MPELAIPSTDTAGILAPHSPQLMGEDAELQQFIATHNLRADLDQAIAISREFFPEATQIGIRLQYLPDDDEFRIIVDVRLNLSVTNASERYWQLLDRWTRELSLKSQGILVANYIRAKEIMDAHRFLTFAETLAESVKVDPAHPDRAAVCRSAISRAYYALFLLGRELLDELGFDLRHIPSPHANLEQALRNSGVLTLRRLANALRRLCSLRTQADYVLHAEDVESLTEVQDVINDARTAILQLNIIRYGRLSPPLDRDAIAEPIMNWAKENSKPLRKKGTA